MTLQISLHEQSWRRTPLVDRPDIRVIERSWHLGLTLKPREPIVVA